MCILFLLAELVVLIPFWPLGIPLIIIAALVDSKHRTDHYCSACANTAAPTSQLCPTCHSPFEKHSALFTFADRAKASILLTAMTLPILFLLLWIMSRI